jgi:phospholipase C
MTCPISGMPESGILPSVSFLKAPYYQTGHARASDPIDEQIFLVNRINRLQKLPEWNNTAAIIVYDHTGGWYDHVMPPIVSHLMIQNMICYLDQTVFAGIPPLVVIKLNVVMVDAYLC